MDFVWTVWGKVLLAVLQPRVLATLLVRDVMCNILSVAGFLQGFSREESGSFVDFSCFF